MIAISFFYTKVKGQQVVNLDCFCVGTLHLNKIYTGVDKFGQLTLNLGAYMYNM